MPQIPVIDPSGLIQQPNIDSPDRQARYAEQAAGQLADTVLRGVDAQQRQQQEQQKAAQAVARQQEQAEAQVSIINAASAAHVKALTTFQDTLNSGSPAGATDATLKQFDQDTKDGLTGISQAYQAHYQAHMATLRGDLAVSLGQRENGARNVQLGADTAAGVDSDARLAMVDPSQTETLIAQRTASINLLPIPPGERAKLISESSQRTAYAAASTIADKNPQGFLASLTPEGVQKDPILSHLDPRNLESLRNHTTSLVAQQANAAQRDRDAAEKIGMQTYNGLVDFVNQGHTPDLNYIAQVRRDTLGTSMEQSAGHVLELAAKTAGFGSQSLPAQQATLAQLESQLSKGTNPDDVKMLASLRTISASQQSAFKDDPLSAYTQFAKGPPMPAQTVTSVDQAIQLAASRAGALPSVEAYGGVAGVSPLHPAEAQQLGEQIRKLPPDQAATALASLGGVLGTPDRISAVGKQLQDKDGTLGLAMAYAGTQTNTGRLVGELVIRGDNALHDKAVQIDDTKVNGWRASAAALIRDAFGDSKVEDQAIDAAVKIEAGREAMGQSADASMATAVRLATNGVITRGAGRTVLPQGMDEDTFNSKIGALGVKDLQAQAPDSMLVAGRSMIPLNTFVRQLPNATLQVLRNGQYAVKAGNSIVTNTAGKPIELTVK